MVIVTVTDARRSRPGVGDTGTATKSLDGDKITITAGSDRTGRVRGYAPWNPRTRTRVVLDQVHVVLDEYRDHWPLTIRQVFYRLVGRFDFPKTENDYARLCEYLNRGRRAGMVPWHAIRDDGVTAATNYFTTADPRTWLSWNMPRPDQYELDPQGGQPVYLELWCEAAGMVPMLHRIVANYGVPVYSFGGFGSVTALREAAQRTTYRDVPTRVLHVGDYDPSGVTIFESAAADVAAFGGNVVFERVALLPDQIRAFDLPTAPPKKNDKRSAFSDDHTVQLESMDPSDVTDVLQAAVAVTWDDEAADDVQLQQAAARGELAAAITELIGGDHE